MQTLLSLPPNLVDTFAELEQKPLPEWVAASDPPQTKLGSAGGTANLLVEAWRKTADGQSFAAWLRASRKLMIHAGGQSRRLPAYAPSGKILTPVPVFRWSRGQRLDQTLLDLQLPLYRRLLNNAPPDICAMVTSGDVLLRCGTNLPALPDADVVCLGQWVPPEQASNHGVFFCPRQHPQELAFFLHKPSPEKIRELAEEYLFLIDTGAWLFSERAVRLLMRRTGWNWEHERFDTVQPQCYELYSDFGLGLGGEPTQPDSETAQLASAVVPLPQGEFYHFGTTRDVIRSCSRLQNVVLDQRMFETAGLKPHPDMFVQNAPVGIALKPENHTLWIENAVVPGSWCLASEHMITGVPDNDWHLHFKRGQCLDLVPVGERDWCVRLYGMDDSFRGAPGHEQTRWLNAPLRDWFEKRDIDPAECGIDLDGDIQQAPLFPVVSESQLTEAFLQWLLDAGTDPAPPESRHDFCRELWCGATRLSAQDIASQANLQRLCRQRQSRRKQILPVLAANASRSVFYNLDLDATAREYAASSHPLPKPELPPHAPLMHRVHAEMFRSSVLRYRGHEGWEASENRAFQLMRKAVIGTLQQTPVSPSCQVQEDQIIWGRCPVRLDLAGGWTDTPPHCLMHGGKVVNLAVNLNGQPPIQVFARRCPEPHVVLRSIDLGVEERIATREELRGFMQVGSGFSIAKAALALAGFLPEFQSRDIGGSLEKQLRQLGGGIEISLLAAVPKGSGLGTSSVLAATLLGTLNDFWGLGWDRTTICQRTLVLEQMLTTGGGWQDQIGGITRGLKLAETHPGFDQTPLVHWLPTHLFCDPEPKSTMLLYYTGITRVAKGYCRTSCAGCFSIHVAISLYCRNLPSMRSQRGMSSFRTTGTDSATVFLVVGT